MKYALSAVVLSAVIGLNIHAAPVFKLTGPDVNKPLQRGETAVFTLTANENNQAVKSGGLTFRITNSWGQVVLERRHWFCMGNPVRFEYKPSAPGIYIAETLGSVNEQERPLAPSGGYPRRPVACAPLEIQPGAPEPADFDAFWQKALTQSKITPVTLSELPDNWYPTHHAKLLQITVNGTAISGILSIPRASGKYPVAVSLPGAGPGVLKPWMSSGQLNAIHLTVNVHHYPWSASAEQQKKNYQEFHRTLGMPYAYSGAETPERYFYFPVIVAISHLIDYVAALPEFDGKHLTVSGSSQGAAMAVAAGALNRNVTALSLNVPAMCDHFGARAGRRPGWPDLLNNRPDAEKTAGYFDTVNFAARIRVPVLMAVGYLDRTAPAVGGYAAFNRMTGRKTMIPMPFNSHEVPKIYGDASKEFLQRELGLSEAAAK